MKKIQSLGFTLIELLVVISIIGLLAALTLTGFTAARRNARDTRRKSDMAQYRTAVEAYASNQDGIYPIPDGNTWGSGCTNSCIFDLDNGRNPIVNEYLPEVIDDPRAGESVCDGTNSCCYYYYADADGTQWTLSSRLETGGWWQICSDGRAGHTTAVTLNDTCDL